MTPIRELVLSDTHAHLESYEPEALNGLISHGQAQGVRTIIANGITLRSSAKSVEVAERYPFIWATVGLHPFYAIRLRNSVAALGELALKKKVVGIGEIGLDFFRHPEPRECQIPLFHDQLRLARDLDLPVVIHTKAAHQETLKAIKKFGIAKGRGIIQGFREDVATLKDWLNLGLYLSVGVTVLKDPSQGLFDMIRAIPSERLLIETDASAIRSRSQGLELATLRPIAEKIAEIRGITIEELGRTTTDNLMQVFKITEKNDRQATGDLQ